MSQPFFGCVLLLSNDFFQDHESMTSSKVQVFFTLQAVWYEPQLAAQLQKDVQHGLI